MNITTTPVTRPNVVIELTAEEADKLKFVIGKQTRGDMADLEKSYHCPPDLYDFCLEMHLSLREAVL